MSRLRVALAPGDKDGAGVNHLRPPAVIGIALVEDVSGALFQRHGAAGHDVVDLGRGHVEPHRPALPRIVEQVQFQPARAGIGLGPREAIALERDRRGVEQPNESLAVAAQCAGGHRDQRRRDVAEHRRRPLGIGVRQRRAARRAQIEVVKPAAVRAQPGDDLAQAGQPRQLREQQALQMPLAGPGVVAAAHPAITIMCRHCAGNDPTIQRFQQTLKRGRGIGHGRPQNHVWQHDFGQHLGFVCRALIPSTQNPGQQCACAGVTTV